MNSVLGHEYALVRLYWAGNNLSYPGQPGQMTCIPSHFTTNIIEAISIIHDPYPIFNSVI